MAYTTIKKPSDYFNTKLYTGTGSELAVTGIDFQPDWTWIKNRDTADWHRLLDSVRGATEELYSNDAGAEATQAQSLKSFDSNGFTLGTLAEVNTSGENYASWNWLGANGTSANTDGSISSTVSANTTSGFSIVSYTGTGSLGTIGHGLGVAPKVVIVKRYSAAADWVYYTTAIDGSLDYLFLNTTAAKADASVSVPTSTVFSKSDTNNETQIAYCFAEKQGFSKFGSYVGNGSTDGTFIYTGFKPAFVIYKGAVGANAADNWEMADNKRSPYNGIENVLYPNLSNAEGTGVTTRMDFLSNGFKMRTSGSDYNGSGQTYIYMAFAEEPLVGDNPATAR